MYRCLLLLALVPCAPPLMAAAATPADAPASAPAPSYFHQRLAGRIGDKSAVTFDLKNRDGELSGSYRYDKRRVDLYLRGKLETSGAFVMDEFDGSKVTGTFQGTVAGGHMTGTWRAPDGSRTLPFVADQTSEVLIGSKREILAAAVGTYPLASISGSGGANGMWDTWKDHGRWRSSVSGISNGMRAASEIALSKADRALLDSLQTVIDADLSVRLMARGKQLLKIPFQPDGMAHELKLPHNEVAMGPLKSLSATSTVLDERLYLLVRDGVDYSQALSGSFEALAQDILVVSYGVVDKDIELNFVVGECCGGTRWVFSRRK